MPSDGELTSKTIPVFIPSQVVGHFDPLPEVTKTLLLALAVIKAAQSNFARAK
jgi:hypothetical protein